MKLGMSINGPVVSHSKWLTATRTGAIVRNGCRDTDSLDEGVWFKKTERGWLYYDPKTGACMDSVSPMGSADIFLPVQVMTHAQISMAKSTSPQPKQWKAADPLATPTYICPECSAVVSDRGTHRIWHAGERTR